MMSANAAMPWRRNLRLLWGGHLLSTASLTAIVPFLPMFMEQLGEKEHVIGWSGLALAAPAVSYSLTAPLWGKLGDRIGRKWMVVRALAGIAVLLILMSFIQTAMQLLVLRLLQGALGGVVDAGVAFAAGSVQENQRGKTLGMLDGAVAAGSFLGPLLVGLLWEPVGFRSLMLACGSLLLLWSMFCAVGLKEGERNRGIPVNRKREVRAVLRQLLSDRRCAAFLAAGICVNMGAYGLVTVFAPRVREMTELSGHAAMWIGILQGVTWAASWVAASWWGKRNDRFPVERNFAIAAALCGVAVMLQGFANTPEWLIGLRLLQGFAFSALLQSVFYVVCRTIGENERGAGIGSASSLLVVGQIAGPLISGVLGSMLSTTLIFVQFGAIFGIGAILVLTVSRPRLIYR
jgi:MFS family permease